MQMGEVNSNTVIMVNFPRIYSDGSLAQDYTMADYSDVVMDN